MQVNGWLVSIVTWFPEAMLISWEWDQTSVLSFCLKFHVVILIVTVQHPMCRLFVTFCAYLFVVFTLSSYNNISKMICRQLWKNGNHEHDRKVPWDVWRMPERHSWPLIPLESERQKGGFLVEKECQATWLSLALDSWSTTVICSPQLGCPCPGGDSGWNPICACQVPCLILRTAVEPTPSLRLQDLGWVWGCGLHGWGLLVREEVSCSEEKQNHFSYSQCYVFTYHLRNLFVLQQNTSTLTKSLSSWALHL